MKLMTGITLCFIVFPALIFAQDTISLDPVSIGATLKPINVSRTGRNIIVIKGDEFNKLPVHTVDELLRYLPGVEVQARGPMGSQSDIVIRGGTFQQVLVVLDGLRLNDPNSGHFTGYIPIAPSEIDRIEIVKGASSAIYGSEAVGGVIHIITKTFASKNNDSKKGLLLQASGGEYGLWGVNAGGFFQQKNTAISAGVLSNNADGQQQRGTKGYFNNNTASFSIAHHINDNLQVSLRTAYDKRKFSAQNFYTTFKSDTANETVESLWNQFRINYKKGANSISVDAGYKQVKDRYAFNSAGAPNRNKSTLMQVLGLYEHIISDNTTLSGGLQVQNKKIISNDRGDHTLVQAAGFVILNQNMGDLRLMPAIRIDYTQHSGTEVVPQLNVSYKKNNLQLRASAGKTIRQADFTERYNNYNKTLVTSGSIGNPDLEAEHSFSYEAGADVFVKSFLKISATAFKRDQQDLIDWTPTPYSMMPRKNNLSPAGTYALAKNISKVNTSGFETDIQFTKSLENSQHFRFMTGFTWLNSKSSDSVLSFYISSHAKFSNNFSIAYDNKYFAISMNGVYKKRKPQTATAINARLSRDYFIMNLRAEIFLLKKFSVFAQADNLLDANYSDLLGSQMPGRWLMGGLKLEL
jgi:iron complex outermembrane receptor protein